MAPKSILLLLQFVLLLSVNCVVGHESHEHEHHPHHHHHETKNDTSVSSPQTLLHNFNVNFVSLVECRHTTCECLWNVDNLIDRVGGNESDTQTLSHTSGALVHQQQQTNPGKAVDAASFSPTAATTSLAINALRNIFQFSQLELLQHPVSGNTQHRPEVSPTDDNNHVHRGVYDCRPKANPCQHSSRNESEALEFLFKRTAPRALLTPQVTVNDSASFHNSLTLDLDDLLKNVAKFTSGRQNSTRSCFTAEDVLDDLEEKISQREFVKTPKNILGIVAHSVVSRIARGECVESVEQRFVQDIMQRYSGQANSIDQSQFVKLLNDLHIGGFIERRQDNQDEHHHEHDHDHDKHEEEEHPEQKQQQQSGDKLNRNSKRRSLSAQVNHSSESVTTTTAASNLSPHHIHVGHKHEHPQRRSSNTGCLDHQFYLKESHQGRLTEQNLRELAPIFLQQILSGACERIEPEQDSPDHQHHSHSHSHSHEHPHDHEHEHEHHQSNRQNSSTESRMQGIESQRDSLTTMNFEDQFSIYMKATAAVAIISISSLCGVILLPFLKTTFYKYLINVLVGLAFGCMAGDALFHLLPSVLGVHKHGGDGAHDAHNHDHDHDHDHGHEHSFKHLWLMVTVLATIYALYIFESISAALNGGGGHSHSHEHPKHLEQSAKGGFNSDNDLKSSQITIHSDSPDSYAYTNQNYISDCKSRSTSMVTITTNSGLEVVGHRNQDKNQEVQEFTEEKHAPVLCGLSSLALMITLGDALHNFMDGITIGIAFNTGSAAGISTSIAVLCHELPHEFGDFAVLLSTGLSVRRAALVNLLSACTCFLGLYLGLWLGSNSAAEPWALAICTGLFLYVALVGMLGELKQKSDDNVHWSADLITKNLGIISGILFMVVLARFEDSLSFQ